MDACITCTEISYYTYLEHLILDHGFSGSGHSLFRVT